MKTLRNDKLPSRQTFFVTLFVIVSLFALFIPYFKLDLLISAVIQGIHSQTFATLMWFISNIGNQPTMVIIVGLTSLTLFLFKLRVEAVICLLSAAGSALSGSLLKLLIARPRPSDELIRVSVWLSDNSYPSNHVLVFTVFFGFLLYLLFTRSRWRIREKIAFVFLATLIAFIGVSRIYLGVHWPSDVVGGYLLGVIWLIITINIYHLSNGQR